MLIVTYPCASVQCLAKKWKYSPIIWHMEDSYCCYSSKLWWYIDLDCISTTLYEAGITSLLTATISEWQNDICVQRHFVATAFFTCIQSTVTWVLRVKCKHLIVSEPDNNKIIAELFDTVFWATEFQTVVCFTLVWNVPIFQQKYFTR